MYGSRREILKTIHNEAEIGDGFLGPEKKPIFLTESSAARDEEKRLGDEEIIWKLLDRMGFDAEKVMATSAGQKKLADRLAADLLVESVKKGKPIAESIRRFLPERVLDLFDRIAREEGWQSAQSNREEAKSGDQQTVGSFVERAQENADRVHADAWETINALLDQQRESVGAVNKFAAEHIETLNRNDSEWLDEWHELKHKDQTARAQEIALILHEYHTIDTYLTIAAKIKTIEQFFSVHDDADIREEALNLIQMFNADEEAWKASNDGIKGMQGAIAEFERRLAEQGASDTFSAGFLTEVQGVEPAEFSRLAERASIIARAAEVTDDPALKRAVGELDEYFTLAEFTSKKTAAVLRERGLNNDARGDVEKVLRDAEVRLMNIGVETSTAESFDVQTASKHVEQLESRITEQRETIGKAHELTLVEQEVRAFIFDIRSSEGMQIKGADALIADWRARIEKCELFSDAARLQLPVVQAIDELERQSKLVQERSADEAYFESSAFTTCGEFASAAQDIERFIELCAKKDGWWMTEREYDDMQAHVAERLGYLKANAGTYALIAREYALIAVILHRSVRAEFGRRQALRPGDVERLRASVVRLKAQSQATEADIDFRSGAHVSVAALSGIINARTEQCNVLRETITVLSDAGVSSEEIDSPLGVVEQVSHASTQIFKANAGMQVAGHELAYARAFEKAGSVVLKSLEQLPERAQNNIDLELAHATGKAASEYALLQQVADKPAQFEGTFDELAFATTVGEIGSECMDSVGHLAHEGFANVRAFGRVVNRIFDAHISPLQTDFQSSGNASSAALAARLIGLRGEFISVIENQAHEGTDGKRIIAVDRLREIFATDAIVGRAQTMNKRWSSDKPYERLPWDKRTSELGRIAQGYGLVADGLKSFRAEGFSDQQFRQLEALLSGVAGGHELLKLLQDRNALIANFLTDAYEGYVVDCQERGEDFVSFDMFVSGLSEDEIREMTAPGNLAKAMQKQGKGVNFWEKFGKEFSASTTPGKVALAGIAAFYGLSLLFPREAWGADDGDDGDGDRVTAARIMAQGGNVMEYFTNLNRQYQGVEVRSQEVAFGELTPQNVRGILDVCYEEGISPEAYIKKMGHPSFGVDVSDPGALKEWHMRFLAYQAQMAEKYAPLSPYYGLLDSQSQQVVIDVMAGEAARSGHNRPIALEVSGESEDVWKEWVYRSFETAYLMHPEYFFGGRFTQEEIRAAEAEVARYAPEVIRTFLEQARQTASRTVNVYNPDVAYRALDAYVTSLFIAVLNKKVDLENDPIPKVQMMDVSLRSQTAGAPYLVNEPINVMSMGRKQESDDERRIYEVSANYVVGLAERVHELQQEMESALPVEQFRKDIARLNFGHGADAVENDPNVRALRALVDKLETMLDHAKEVGGEARSEIEAQLEEARTLLGQARDRIHGIADLRQYLSFEPADKKHEQEISSPATAKKKHEPSTAAEKESAPLDPVTLARLTFARHFGETPDAPGIPDGTPPEVTDALGNLARVVGDAGMSAESVLFRIKSVRDEIAQAARTLDGDVRRGAWQEEVESIIGPLEENIRVRCETKQNEIELPFIYARSHVAQVYDEATAQVRVMPIEVRTVLSEINELVNASRVDGTAFIAALKRYHALLEGPDGDQIKTAIPHVFTAIDRCEREYQAFEMRLAQQQEAIQIESTLESLRHRAAESIDAARAVAAGLPDSLEEVLGQIDGLLSRSARESFDVAIAELDKQRALLESELGKLEGAPAEELEHVREAANALKSLEREYLTIMGSMRVRAAEAFEQAKLRVVDVAENIGSHGIDISRARLFSEFDTGDDQIQQAVAMESNLMKIYEEIRRLEPDALIERFKGRLIEELNWQLELKAGTLTEKWTPDNLEIIIRDAGGPGYGDYQNPNERYAAFKQDIPLEEFLKIYQQQYNEAVAKGEKPPSLLEAITAGGIYDGSGSIVLVYKDPLNNNRQREYHFTFREVGEGQYRMRNSAWVNYAGNEDWGPFPIQPNLFVENIGFEDLEGSGGYRAYCDTLNLKIGGLGAEGDKTMKINIKGFNVVGKTPESVRLENINWHEKVLKSTYTLDGEKRKIDGSLVEELVVDIVKEFDSVEWEVLTVEMPNGLRVEIPNLAYARDQKQIAFDAPSISGKLSSGEAYAAKLPGVDVDLSRMDDLPTSWRAAVEDTWGKAGIGSAFDDIVKEIRNVQKIGGDLRVPADIAERLNAAAHEARQYGVTVPEHFGDELLSSVGAVRENGEWIINEETIGKLEKRLQEERERIEARVAAFGKRVLEAIGAVGFINASEGFDEQIKGISFSEGSPHSKSRGESVAGSVSADSDVGGRGESVAENSAGRIRLPEHIARHLEAMQAGLEKCGIDISPDWSDRLLEKAGAVKDAHGKWTIDRGAVDEIARELAAERDVLRARLVAFGKDVRSGIGAVASELPDIKDIERDIGQIDFDRGRITIPDSLEQDLDRLRDSLRALGIELSEKWKDELMESAGAFKDTMGKWQGEGKDVLDRLTALLRSSRAEWERKLKGRVEEIIGKGREGIGKIVTIDEQSGTVMLTENFAEELAQRGIPIRGLTVNRDGTGALELADLGLGLRGVGKITIIDGEIVRTEDGTRVDFRMFARSDLHRSSLDVGMSVAFGKDGTDLSLTTADGEQVLGIHAEGNKLIDGDFAERFKDGWPPKNPEDFVRLLRNSAGVQSIEDLDLTVTMRLGQVSELFESELPQIQKIKAIGGLAQHLTQIGFLREEVTFSAAEVAQLVDLGKDARANEQHIIDILVRKFTGTSTVGHAHDLLADLSQLKFEEMLHNVLFPKSESTFFAEFGQQSGITKMVTMQSTLYARAGAQVALGKHAAGIATAGIRDAMYTAGPSERMVASLACKEIFASGAITVETPIGELQAALNVSRNILENETAKLLLRIGSDGEETMMVPLKLDMPGWQGFVAVTYKTKDGMLGPVDIEIGFLPVGGATQEGGEGGKIGFAVGMGVAGKAALDLGKSIMSFARDANGDLTLTAETELPWKGGKAEIEATEYHGGEVNRMMPDVFSAGISQDIRVFGLNTTAGVEVKMPQGGGPKTYSFKIGVHGPGAGDGGSNSLETVNHDRHVVKILGSAF